MQLKNSIEMIMQNPLLRFSQYGLYASLGVTLLACGGGSGTAAPPAPAPAPTATVSAVTPVAPLSYGKLVSIDVAGANLDLGVTLTAPGCTGLAESAGSSAALKRFTCTLTAATALPVEVKSVAGVSLFSASLPVPDPQVTLVTSLGTVVFELNPAKAPLSVNNFLKYTSDGFYANLLFHRVIPNFVIQAGGFTSGPVSKAATYGPIKLESNNGLSNLRGSLAMARTQVADSATSEFYINTVNNAALDFVSASQPGYAVFGKVVDGLPVVDAIAAVPTANRGGLQNVPVSDVLILSARQTR